MKDSRDTGRIKKLSKLSENGDDLINKITNKDESKFEKEILSTLVDEINRKDEIIFKYWNEIQLSRISNRIRKIVGLPPIILSDVARPFDYRKGINFNDLNQLRIQIEIQNKLIERNWLQIQEMRLINRLRRTFSFRLTNSNILLRLTRSCYTLILKNIKNIIRYIKQNGTQRLIEEFVKTNFDHGISVDLPLVSIIILNRNGLGHLKPLVKFFIENTIYPNYEIIVFDNQSIDKSIQYLESIKELPIRIVKNNYNDSFSSANNKAVKLAKGKLIVFLNNDVLPLYGWLNQMIKTYYSYSNIGMVGSKLIYPRKYGFEHSFKIQHNGIGFKSEEGFLRPYNLDQGKEIFEVNNVNDFNYPSVTAACALISKSDFVEIGGFDENYLYGLEDVDLGLKLNNKKNVIAHASVLFHNEYGTQKSQDPESIRERRVNNINYFREKWYRKLIDQAWFDKLNSLDRLKMEYPKMTFGITVSEQGEDAKAGDYFTALELGGELEKLGYIIRYYAKNEGDWYQIHKDVDVLIVLLHNYDLSQIQSLNNNLIKVAWIRNWFDVFIESNWFNKFNLVFSSSQKACQMIESKYRKKAYYLPIATNHHRFGKKHNVVQKYKCDYCFTGSYWNDPREIINLLNPENLNEFTFKLYGDNWDQIPKFKKFSLGFVKYYDIPKIYASTKLLIDDANRVTKPWGSVNSRVFDAILSGVLVITNGELGSKELFDGDMPVFKSAQELEQLIRFYLVNEDERLKLIKKLQDKVKRNHTYTKRAAQIKNILKSYYKNSLVIKIPVPYIGIAHQWGDYHFSLSLQKEFERLGYRTKVEFLHEWDNESSFSYENVLVIRGLSIYSPKKFQKNFMWNISHPNRITIDEYLTYDHVFVASKKWTSYLAKKGLKNVSMLLQCTDPEIFKIPSNHEKVKTELLFVGNSRGIYRKIINDLLPTKYDLSIYGGGWDLLDIDQNYVKESHLNNRELYKFYGGASILLNDHWDDMREFGFISNRLFDAMACNATVISDNLEGIDEVFNNQIQTYENREDLLLKIDSILNSKENSMNSGRQLILNLHTFGVRAKQIVKQIQKTN